MTDKVRKFCEVYFSTGCNCLQAFIATHPNQTMKSARSNAYKFIKRPEVEAALEEWREQTESRTKHAVIALEEHLLNRMAVDVNNYINIDASGFISVKDLTKMPAEMRQLIKCIEPTEAGAKVVLESRDKAIETFCKLHGLTKDTINITTSEQLSDVMNQLSGGVVFDEPDDEPTESESNSYGF